MNEKFNQLASQERITAVISSFSERNIKGVFVETKEDALKEIFAIIPVGAEIATGSSETLREIGLLTVLKEKSHPWKNVKDNLFTEVDHLKREELRRESILADYNLQSCHAVTENGQLLIASGMGNQIAAIAYASKHIIFVVGVQKIVKNLDEAFERIHNYVVPLENERMKKTGFKKGTTLGKLLIFEKEIRDRDVHVILVNEKLGF